MTFRSHTSVASSLLVTILSLSHGASALNAMTYKGCYSSSTPLTDQGSAQYQTNGACQQICAPAGYSVLGLSGGSDCWCGNQLPATNSKVDDSKCSTPCNGFGDIKCGGTGFYSVYLTGTTDDVTAYGDSSSSSSTGTAGTSASTASSTTTPSVVTSVSPGNTVLVTVSASAQSSSSNNSSGGTSTAGIAAGVVVGIVGVVALGGGIFFLLRRRRRRQAEEDYKRSAQVSDFMSGSKERKPPNTAYSQMSDSRLDPEHGRRNSVGSMADEHDYSRRILRVSEPIPLPSDSVLTSLGRKPRLSLSQPKPGPVAIADDLMLFLGKR